MNFSRAEEIPYDVVVIRSWRRAQERLIGDMLMRQLSSFELGDGEDLQRRIYAGNADHELSQTRRLRGIRYGTLL